MCNISHSLLLNIPRTPPLTLLHLSASKFSDTPSAGGIAGFLSSDVTSTQSPTSKTPTQVKNESTCKQPGIIQSFFQKAAEKQRQKTTKGEEEDHEDADTTVSVPSSSSHKTSATDCQLETDTSCHVSSFSLSSHSKNSSASPNTGISSFFHKKTVERSLQAAASTLSTLETGQKPVPINTEHPEDTAAAVSGLQVKDSDVKDSAGFTSHQFPREELKDELDIEGEKNHQLSTVAREDLMNCDRCGQEVLVWEMPEHNDYHFALDLQNSLSASTGSAAAPSSSTSSSSSVSLTPHRVGASTRGKTKTRGQSGPQPKRHRSQGGNSGTLDSFFKRN